MSQLCCWVGLRLSTGSIHQIKTIFCISFLEIVLLGGLFQVMEWLCKSIPGAHKGNTMTLEMVTTF